MVKEMILETLLFVIKSKNKPNKDGKDLCIKALK